MTKLAKIQSLLGLELITTTTCYNVHGVDVGRLGFNKNSMLNRALNSIDFQGDSNKGDDMVTVVVGAIGRSQHSPTDLHIFKGVLSNDHPMWASSFEYKLTNLR